MKTQNSNNVNNSTESEEKKALGQVAIGTILVTWFFPDIIGFFVGFF